MSSIILPTNFDVSKLSFGNVKTLDNGGKIVGVYYDSKPLVLQTPEMSAPFGISKWSPDGPSSANEKHTLELSFKGRDERKSLDAFFNVLSALDKFMVEGGMERSQEWFKKKFSVVDVVEALYTPCVKHAKDKMTGEITDKYPPTFRLSLPTKDGKYTFDTYDNDKERVDLSQIETKGAKVTAIIQFNGVWLAGGKFGCMWKTVQMRVVPPSTIKGFAFQDLEDDKLVDSDIDDVDEPVVKTKAAASKVRDVDEDDDDDHEVDIEDEPKPRAPTTSAPVTVETSDEEEDEEEEQPKVVAKKSVLVRKKAPVK